MWCVEAKAKIDIPLGENPETWDNNKFVNFIKSKSNGCQEFSRAIEWLGNRNYNEAIRDCRMPVWLRWLENNIVQGVVVKAGDVITVTHGRNEKFAIWHNTGIWDLPEEYVGETVKVVAKE